MNQLTMELKNSEYLAIDAPVSEQILYRLDSGGQRFYYDLIDDEPSFYQSVTTFIGNNLKSSVFLDKSAANVRDR